MDSSLPRTPSFNLAGKRALVAGASSGIGVGCAAALCEAGAAVTLVARSSDTLEELQKQMISEGWDATARPLDVTDINATKQMIENELPFDILVNSAGMARHSASLDTTTEDFDAVSELNIKAGYFLNQAVAKKLIEAGKPGSLMTISSLRWQLWVALTEQFIVQPSTQQRDIQNHSRSNGVFTKSE